MLKGAPCGWCDLEFNPRPVAHDRPIHGSPSRGLLDETCQVLGTADALTVKLYKDVARPKPSLVGRTTLSNLRDDRTLVGRVTLFDIPNRNANLCPLHPR